MDNIIVKTLITNDDGVTEYGLKKLHEIYSQTHDCLVVAPDNNCSGASHSLTLDRPLRIKNHANGFLSLNGTPADCTYLALHNIFDYKFDRILSGINLGANLGDDISYSGTVAAAMEGRYLDKTAIAISSCGSSKSNIDTSAKVIAKFLPFLDDVKLPPGTILNINIPDVSYENIAGCQVTVLGKRSSPAFPIKMIDPRGNACYWVGAVGEPAANEVGTDFYAIANNYVSITPLQGDKTNHHALSYTKSWLKDFECEIC